MWTQRGDVAAAYLGIVDISSSLHAFLPSVENKQTEVFSFFLSFFFYHCDLVSKAHGGPVLDVSTLEKGVSG